MWAALREAWRLMWKLGGPFGVLVFRLDGSLDRRIDEIQRG